MIKVIDGKRYNTDTANEIYCYWNGYGSGDFKHRSKTLYQTKKGAWFLHHVGGALSDMAVSAGNGTCGSANIEPIDEDDAFGFLQAHSGDREARTAIDEYFEDRIEDA